MRANFERETSPKPPAPRQGVSPIVRLVFWSLLLASFSAVLAYGGNRPVPWTLLSLAALIGFAAVLADDAVRGRRFGDPWLVVAGGLYGVALTWGVLQTIGGWAPAGWLDAAWSRLEAPARAASISLDPRAGWQTLLKMAAFAMLFAIGVRAGASRRATFGAIDALALFAAGLALFGIWAAFAGWNPLLGEDAIRLAGVTASFVNRNSFAFFAGLGLLAAIAAIDRRVSQSLEGSDRTADLLRALLGPALLYVVCAVVVATALVLSASRGGLAAAVVGLAVYVASGRGGAERSAARMGPRRILTALGLISVATVLAIGSDRLFDRLEGTTLENDGRLATYRLTLETWWDRPTLGHGLGAYAEALRPHVPEPLASNERLRAHNLYLELLLELGWPAFACWAAALAIVAARVAFRPRSRTSATDSRRRFALAILAAAALHSAIDFPLQMAGTAAVWALLIGLAAAPRKDRPALG